LKFYESGFSNDSLIIIWDLNTGTILKKLRKNGNEYTTSIAVLNKTQIVLGS